MDEGIESGEDVVSAFKDEEAKIEKILRARHRNSNRELIDGAGKVAFHATAAATTGGISAIISVIAAALGGKHLADSLIPSLRKRFEEPDEPRESQFYYAWRMKRNLVGKARDVIV
ncbi:hypothetical protein RFM26_23045 [Mesorhizobium sp. VK23B]|uniref:SMODS and SLOG-associating 2TM effector domain-containing protein n=1 Tax=Mesorhizobium dulcispinae TaxID=3072316 RepID=A0ABU4XND7_9HYPH|nr:MULTISPECIES: hypothetical protein [unclassified Mesorhizobium]MDX8468585.1 hypothetical protein [Mesorhizobium sp. VK23B]MDX8475074.1 hypothetical protein [Mesorhizobium sp. VK23A]